MHSMRCVSWEHVDYSFDFYLKHIYGRYLYIHVLQKGALVLHVTVGKWS
jgi:hypothetical protein